MKLNDIPIAWIHIITIITWKGPSLSSTRQFNAKGPLFFCPENPSVSHEKSVSSPRKNCQFHTKKASVHQKNRQFNTKKHQFNTLTLFMCWTESFMCWTDAFVWWTDGCGELTHLTCWSDGFSGLKRTGPGVELICLTEGYSMKTIPTKYYNVRYLQVWFLQLEAFFVFTWPKWFLSELKYFLTYKITNLNLKF